MQVAVARVTPAAGPQAVARADLAGALEHLGQAVDRDRDVVGDLRAEQAGDRPGDALAPAGERVEVAARGRDVREQRAGGERLAELRDVGLDLGVAAVGLGEHEEAGAGGHGDRERGRRGGERGGVDVLERRGLGAAGEHGGDRGAAGRAES